MELSRKEYKRLQIAENVYAYLRNYENDLYKRITVMDKRLCNAYDFVMALYQVIYEQGIDYNRLETYLQDKREEMIEDLQVGTEDLNSANGLPLISCILLRIELMNINNMVASKLHHSYDLE